MTTKTRRELVDRALTELGRRYGGEAGSSEDYDEVDALVDPLIEQMAADRVVYVDDVDNIEAAFFLPVARLLAAVAAPTFGKSATESLLTNTNGGNVDMLVAREERILRRINAETGSGEVVKAKYY
jgi:hypothetical protein